MKDRKTYGTRRFFMTSLFSLLGLVLLLKYQNCAPAGPITSTEFSDSGPGTIDDSKSSSSVFFPEKSIELQNANLTFEVGGICSEEQSGAILAWYLVGESSNAIVKSGRAHCDLGGFRVVVDDSQALDCGESYKLQAHLGAGGKGEVLVVRRCRPASGS